MEKDNKGGLGSMIICLIGLLVAVVLLLSSCSRNIYIPVESVRTEYKDKILRDSIHLHDSVWVKMQGDTIWLEKYKTLYKEKIVKDSVLLVDTIRVPYPVIEYKEVNKLTSFQTVRVWLDNVFMLLIGLGLIVLVLKWKRLF